MPVSVVDQNGTAWISWTGATANTSTETWPLWVNQTAATTSAVTITHTIWLDWAGANVSGSGYRQPTPEERETRRIEEEERRKVVAAAKTKARQLLKEVLDREQRRELENDGHFHVQTRDGERVYRIKPGAQPERVKGEDGVRWSYCIHPRDHFPADDTAAALKLLIEANEDEFLRIANATRRGALVAA